MPLTPKEKLQRRLTDPYYSLAEQLGEVSLADQKRAGTTAAEVEKKRNLDPAQAAADERINLDNYLEGRSAGPGLLDIAESSLYQGGMQLSDFFTGQRIRSNEEIQQEADRRAGVTPEARQQLVTEPQQRVIQSLAQGDYLGAIPEAVKAGPGTLAESAVFIPELAAGALLSNVGGRALLKRRGEKVKEGASKLFDRVGKERRALEAAVDRAKKDPLTEGLEGAVKAAGSVSIATADLTQRNINDFREEHGVEPTREEAATMFGINMATMMIEPTIIKQLFIPKFKTQISKEIGQLGKNIISGSNIKSIGKRVGDGALKVAKASGAEAAQEYFQTWGEALNVQMGPEQRENFFQSAMEIFKDKDQQLEALAASYLGGGAGFTARTAITAPAVAAGTTIDTTKGTAKVAAKTVKKAANIVGRGAQAVSNRAAYQVLSQEERDAIRGEYESRKEIVDAKTKELETNVETIKAATSIESLQGDSDVADFVATVQARDGITDENLQSRRELERFKASLIRAYRADIGLLKTELEASNVAAIGKKAAENVKDQSVEAARKAVAAVAPGVEAVVDSVKQYGNQAVKAVKELQSSTALGMIELAANAGKEETKQIVEAAKSLSLDDLNRTAAVISEFKPDLARQLQSVIRQKEKALERTGFRRKNIINEETLNPVIADVAKRGSIKESEAAAVSSAVNAAVAGKIDDLTALEAVESAVAAIENTTAFKTQTKGAMSRGGLQAVKTKLQRVRARLEKDPTIAEKAAKVAKKVADKAAPVVKKAAEKTAEKVAAKAAPKINVSGPFKAVIEAVTETLKKPSQVDVLVKSAPDFANQMKKYGVKTRSDFLRFIDQFPELQDNVEFFSAIEKEFPSDISAKEVFDNMRTKGLATTEAIKEAYNKMNPPECKV